MWQSQKPYHYGAVAPDHMPHFGLGLAFLRPFSSCVRRGEEESEAWEGVSDEGFVGCLGYPSLEGWDRPQVDLDWWEATGPLDLDGRGPFELDEKGQLE